MNWIHASARRIIFLGLAVIVSACAIVDYPTTPAPPVTAAPQPTPVISGGCDTLDDLYTLDNWLQVSHNKSVVFMEWVTQGAKRGADVYSILGELVTIRDAINAVPMPDCALEVNVFLSDALDKAIETFTAYNNGEINSLGDVVGETQRGLDSADSLRLEVAEQMDEKFQALGSS